MNTSLICLSLKYLNKNYKSMCEISKWIDFELIKHIISKEKFIRSLNKKDFEIIDRLIKFDKTIALKFFIENNDIKNPLGHDKTYRIYGGFYYISELIRTNRFMYSLIYRNYNNNKVDVVSYFNI